MSRETGRSSWSRRSAPDGRVTAADFLPTTLAERDARGWDALDILLITGDAYVDHPTFGVPLLGRWLLDHGYRVGIVAQPDWTRADCLTAMGRPRLWAGVSAGALDSLLAHQTAFRRRRHEDAYTPGGHAGARPDRATLVYANLVRQAFPGLPIVLGGVEASLRRAVHYDWWSDRLRRPLLFDAKAELLVYGMGERAALEISRRLAGESGAGEEAAGREEAEREPDAPGAPAEHGARGRRGRTGLDPRLRGIPGTAFLGELTDLPPDAAVVHLPGHAQIAADPRQLLAATLLLEAQVHQGGRWAVQPVGDRWLLLAPPAPPLTTPELDRLYGLPFTRQAHPGYTLPIPALETVRASVTAHRGCAGGCSFCSLALHQGRQIAARSAASILAEVRQVAAAPGTGGAISDIGGPSANMWAAACRADPARCARRSCLVPRPCPHFAPNQAAYLELLDEAAATPGVGSVRVASGLRHDLLLREPAVARGLVARFVGGQLKLAPEHCAPEVLRGMRKPAFDVFVRFLELFQEVGATQGKRQYVVPYLMSGFPGCGEPEMRELRAWLARRGWEPQQVQCFVPTPGTVATAMWYAGVDEAGRPLAVAREDGARRRQHELLVGRLLPEGLSPRRRAPAPAARWRPRRSSR